MFAQSGLQLSLGSSCIVRSHLICFDFWTDRIFILFVYRKVDGALKTSVDIDNIF